MLESHAFFSKMVDELVEFAEYDPELADGIKWLDDQAQKKASHFMIWFLKCCTNMMWTLKQKSGLVQEIKNYFLKSSVLYSHPSGPQYFPT